jgi:hypothetical protein
LVYADVQISATVGVLEENWPGSVQLPVVAREHGMVDIMTELVALLKEN